jgi:hypothetical protein
MRKILYHSPMVLPPLALVLGILVMLDVLPIDMQVYQAFFVVWTFGTFACWVVTVVMAASAILARRWLWHPLALLVLTVTVSFGLAGLLNGSTALFCVFFMCTLAASAFAIYAGVSGTSHHRAFCLGFAICTWVGATLTLLVPAPITGTPNIQVMLWDAAGWGQGSSFYKQFHFVVAAHQGMICLFLTWFFAFTGGWLSELYTAFRKPSPAKEAER